MKVIQWLMLLFTLVKSETSDRSRTDLILLTKELFSVGLSPHDQASNPYLYTSWMDILKQRSLRKDNLSKGERYQFPQDCYGYKVCDHHHHHHGENTERRPSTSVTPLINSGDLQREWSGLTILSNIIIVGSAIIFSGNKVCFETFSISSEYILGVTCFLPLVLSKRNVY